jgi:hypothetical protein
MMSRRTTRGRTAWVAGALVLAAIGAGARSASAQDTTVPTPGPPTSGPLKLERIENQWVAAPDVKVTDIDGDAGVLAGVYGGWVLDRTIMFGGAGYWLTNGSNASELAYGGVLVEWMLMKHDAPIRFGVKTLVGGGTATLGSELQAFGRQGLRTTLPRRVLVRDDFALAEPAATLRVHVLRNVGVTVGVGYRFTSAADILQDRLNGVTGSVAVQIGGW